MKIHPYERLKRATARIFGLSRDRVSITNVSERIERSYSGPVATLQGSEKVTTFTVTIYQDSL
jgi:hypothetical protein